MTQPETRLPDADILDPTGTAFFFDFDGTLADIVDRPEDVRLKPEVADALASLANAANGAVAVISGRSIHQLDQFLAPLRLPLAGVHGLEIRAADGSISTAEFDETEFDGIVAEAQAFADANTGVTTEIKPGSVALHYRRRPECGCACDAEANAIATRHGDVAVMRGKMVVEIKLGGRSKADGLAALMRTPPFEGRTPFFAGDDVTDEDVFVHLPANGVGVKVGDGETAAVYRAATIGDFHDWLVSLARDIAPDDRAGGESRKSIPTGADR